MKDLVLDEAFLRSCVNLPLGVRKEIVSQLQTFTKHPDDPDLDLQRIEPSKELRSIHVDKAHRIIVRVEKAATTLLFVSNEASPYMPPAKPLPPTPVHKPGAYDNDIIIAPVDAIEKLLVEEKYLPLARRLLEIDGKCRDAEFEFPEIEKTLNAHLPPEARRFPNWWANQKTGKRAHAFAWMASGWMVSKVDIKTGLVKFTRSHRRRS